MLAPDTKLGVCSIALAVYTNATTPLYSTAHKCWLFLKSHLGKSMLSIVTYTHQCCNVNAMERMPYDS